MIFLASFLGGGILTYVIHHKLKWNSAYLIKGEKKFTCHIQTIVPWMVAPIMKLFTFSFPHCNDLLSVSTPLHPNMVTKWKDHLVRWLGLRRTGGKAASPFHSKKWGGVSLSGPHCGISLFLDTKEGFPHPCVLVADPWSRPWLYRLCGSKFCYASSDSTLQHFFWIVFCLKGLLFYWGPKKGSTAGINDAGVWLLHSWFYPPFSSMPCCLAWLTQRMYWLARAEQLRVCWEFWR